MSAQVNCADMPDFHAAWSLSRGRFLAELDGLSHEQLNWRLYPGSLSIAEAAIHTAGIEVKFGCAIEGIEVPAELTRVAAAATEGVVNDNPFPYSSEEMTPEYVLSVLQASKDIVEPALLDPTAARREVTMVSALGPVITGEGAMARLTFHAAYHQGQTYQVKNAPGFPA
ncbi:DinB family protein [bacterium]|nr:MAG: DinB family protein [bacterium]